MRGGHPWHRRCILRRHGANVVRLGCIYELLALTPLPLPPLTHICRRWPAFGWVIWLALGHHLLWELAEVADN